MMQHDVQIDNQQLHVLRNPVINYILTYINVSKESDLIICMFLIIRISVKTATLSLTAVYKLADRYQIKWI